MANTVPWRLTRATYHRFQELILLWEQTLEGSDQALAYEDDIRHLPGFPVDYDPERDLIQPVITDLR